MKFSELVDFYHEQDENDKRILQDIYANLRREFDHFPSAHEEDIMAEKCYHEYLQKRYSSDQEYNDVMSANAIWDEINGNIKR